MAQMARELFGKLLFPFLAEFAERHPASGAARYHRRLEADAEMALFSFYTALKPHAAALRAHDPALLYETPADCTPIAALELPWLLPAWPWYDEALPPLPLLPEAARALVVAYAQPRLDAATEAHIWRALHTTFFVASGIDRLSWPVLTALDACQPGGDGLEQLLAAPAADRAACCAFLAELAAEHTEALLPCISRKFRDRAALLAAAVRSLPPSAILGFLATFS